MPNNPTPQAESQLENLELRMNLVQKLGPQFVNPVSSFIATNGPAKIGGLVKFSTFLNEGVDQVQVLRNTARDYASASVLQSYDGQNVPLHQPVSYYDNDTSLIGKTAFYWLRSTPQNKQLKPIIAGPIQVDVPPTGDSSLLPLNEVSNSTNFATVDSLAEGGSATVRVYGTNGVGSAWTRQNGDGVKQTFPSGQVSGLSFATTYQVFWNSATKSYQAFSTYPTTLSDNQVFAGKLTTVSSTGSGGTIGGGGAAGGQGGNRVAQIDVAAGGPELFTNGVLNPTQSKINFQGDGLDIVVSDDALGNETFSKVQFNPNRVKWQEDFTTIGPGVAGTTSFAASAGVGMGDHGFFLFSPNATAPPSFVNASGAPPFSGYAGWTQDATASHTGILYPAMFGANSNTFQPQAAATWLTNLLALFDYPGWQVSIIFRLNPYLNSSASVAFSMAKKAMYVGLMGHNPSSIPNISRPFVFFGTRFDTSTSGTGINDSFLTLEAVSNRVLASPARSNVQGTTKVSTLAPTANTIYRLDITYPPAGGNVTLTLSSGATTVSLTVAVPTLVQGFGGNQAQILTGTFYVEGEAVSGSGLPSVGEGSIGTFSGVTTPAFMQLNGGVFTVKKVNENALAPITLIEFLQSGLTNEVATTINGGAQFVSFPAVYPGVWFGNDDTASPVAGTAAIEVDKIYFDWTGGSIF